LSDEEALFAELENEEDSDVSSMREKRIKEIQDEYVFMLSHVSNVIDPLY
jgi:hypothetical protein